MTEPSRLFLVVFCLLLPAGPDAMADSAKPPAVRLGPKTSVQGYGRQNPDCLAWTNGCVLCGTDGSGHSQCSTPGIACEPHGLTCKRLVKSK